MNAQILTHSIQADRDDVTSRIAPALAASLTAFDGQVSVRRMSDGADLQHALGVRSPR